MTNLLASNLQTHNPIDFPTNMMIRLPLFALMTFALLVSTGCEPTSNEGTSESVNEASVSTTGETEPAIRNVETESNGESVLIDGDLNSVDWNSMIGQEVTLTGNLVVVDTYDLARRGQIKVARDRLYIPTSQVDPNDSDPDANTFEGGSNVANVDKARKNNDEAVLTLDDGSDDENIFPPTLFPNLGKTHPTVRIGSRLNGVTGKLVKSGNKTMLIPSGPLQWTPAQRPERPDVGESKVMVASFNVLNYFTTIDNGSNGARGADSESEFRRQEAKIVAAILALQADVIGLMELENNLESENQLVIALNKELGKEVFKGCGLPSEFRSAPGGKNAIRVGIIYRTDRVEPVGDVAMIRDEAFDVARTPIVQSFKKGSEVKPFTVIVNHFKSKGGSGADDANRNKGDGQGAYNAKRRSQALAISKYIGLRDQGNGEPRVLVIGDLNAYGQEDPIDALRANGLIDLQAQARNQSQSNNTPKPYSFIYYGQSGCLDHAMATSSLAEAVTGIATWHINADEPRFVDYNQEFNPKTLFEPNPFRSSDHDPVLIGIGN